MAAFSPIRCKRCLRRPGPPSVAQQQRAPSVEAGLNWVSGYTGWDFSSVAAETPLSQLDPSEFYGVHHPLSAAEFAPVVAELQRRGRFRTEYEGRTLRERLGTRPLPAARESVAA